MITEAIRATGFVVSEARTSRANALLAPNTSVLPGQVLGRQTGTGQYTALAPVASDGSELAAAIALYRASAGVLAAPVPSIVTAAEVDARALVWPPGITEPQKAAALGQLASLGIVAR